jgi:hypothetical protein
MGRMRNPHVSNWRRTKNKGNKGDDIEDPYFLGKKKYWSWFCKKCGERLEPYKEDQYGDIVLSCSNQGCIMNKMYASSKQIEIMKLLKQQQLNSTLYYRRFDGGYH